jgi:cytoskeletal protein RodZ
MGGMKQGSGDLSFGEEEDEDESPEPESSEEPEETESTGTEVETDETVEVPDGDDADRPGTSTSTSTSAGEARSSSGGSSSRYPYFVRRSNVGDERDNRFELFARDEVVSQESEFRNQLAAELGTDDVAKTDAREYALLAAYNNVEEVAELMREDGYGELD